MTVLHQPMPHEAELGLLALSLAVEPGFGIGGRSMRLVRPLLAVEVRFGVAAAALGRRLAMITTWAVLRLDALHRRPGFDQSAVDREVVARQKLLHLGLGHDRCQELRSDIAL